MIWGAAFSGRETGELMFTRVLCAAALVAGFFCAGASFSGYAEAAPLEAYGALPSIENAIVSPDGNSIAYVRSGKGKRYAIIQSLQSKQVLGAVDLQGEKLRSLAWAGNRHLIVTISQTANARGLVNRRMEWSMAFSFNLDTKKTIPLMEYFNDDIRAMNVVAGIPQPRIIDGRPVVFVEGIYFKSSNNGRLGLFEIDLDSGAVRLVEPGTSETGDFIIDQQGVVIARTEYDSDKRHWALMQRIGGAWVSTFDVVAPIDTPDVNEAVSYDGSALVVSWRNDGDTQFKQFSLRDGSELSRLRPDMQLSGVISDPVTSRIIGVTRLNEGGDYVFFHPRAQTVWNSIQAAYPGASDITLQSWTSDWNKVVVRVAGPGRGDVIDLVDMTTRRADRIGQTYDGIGGEDFAAVQWINYPASDGRKIFAYLTLPRNRAAQNLPLIVLPHGGPATRDSSGFDYIAQAIASRGYAVLQPQFRGSAGFGWDFLSAGFGQWGRKMQTDLSDGVRALAAKGVIDPKRVCITGASYGGYAALAGVTLDAGVYRCAVSIAGISDLESFLTWKRRRVGADSLTMRHWDRFLGAKGVSDPVLASISPIKHVAKVDVPVLLIHGNDDTVVPIDQSEDMEASLRRAGKQVSFIKLDGDDHWLSRSETRLRMLTSAISFLEQHNPPN